MLKTWLFSLMFLVPSVGAQDQGWEDDLGPVMPEQAERFDITQLPKGASVVLPHPATTVSPLELKVQVTATDKKQLLKIGAWDESGSVRSFQLAIYDNNLSRVKYLTIKPGNFVLYHFKNLSTIQLVPNTPKDPALRTMKLLLESNRPLGVSYL